MCPIAIAAIAHHQQFTVHRRTLHRSLTQAPAPAHSMIQSHPSIPPWQSTYRLRLEQRKSTDQVHSRIIHAYQNLAISLRDARERNAAWLHSSSPSHPSTGSTTGTNANANLNPNPRTYIQTIEKQLSHLRLELSDAYRSRASSQEKQLHLGDTLRERDDECRALRDELRGFREREIAGRKRESEWEERYSGREGDVQHLQDELLSLHLELTHLSTRNAALQADNASLLQRWLDKMNERVDLMNMLNEREGEGVSGKAEAEPEAEAEGEGEEKGEQV